MVFSSLEFLLVFFPVFFLIYYLLPFRMKNGFLLIGSLCFYFYGSRRYPAYAFLLIVAVCCDYLLARLIGSSSGRRRKFCLVVGLICNFGWLFALKYAAFVSASLNGLIPALFPGSAFALPLMDWVLPVGISFYTFQGVSYLIDVYRGDIPAEPSLLKLGTYLCMFPVVTAGPIVKYGEVAEHLNRRTFSPKAVGDGAKEFILGLGLKVLLANRIGPLWKAVGTIGFESVSTPLAWMGIAAFSFQIYFDFYGYSLMAVGLGRMLGFELPQNFRYPYTALSMTDFWRRWHITLGRWFREYLYIPLGGNRRGFPITVRNLLIVWLTTGVWHGASWNFVVWGLLLFLLMLIERMGLKKILEKYRPLGRLYMLLVIPLSWLPFAIADFSQLWRYLGRLFPFVPVKDAVIYAGDYLKYGRMYGFLLLLGFVFCTPWPRKVFDRFRDTAWGTLLLLAVFWASLYGLYKGMNDPFMYFQF